MSELRPSSSITAFLLSERSSLWLDRSAILVACVLSAIVLALGTGVDIWRHDSLYVLEDYSTKSLQDRRWLIHLLLDPLVAVAGGQIWLLGNLVFGGFAYRVARGYRQDPRAALLFALLVAQIPSIYGQSLWPAVTLPGLLLLLAASFAHQRMPVAAFYAVFGVLFFGVSQQYYFFLPVLHVPWVLAAGEGRLRATVRLLTFWLLGFAAGWLFAFVVTYLVAGEVSNTALPAWRDPHYVTDLSSLLDNLASRARLLADHVGMLEELILAGLTITAMAALGVAGRARNETLTRLAVFGAIALAIYAATIPVGIRIQFRTVTPLFFGLLAFAFLGSPNRLHRALYPIAALLTLAPFWTLNIDNLRWYRTVTDEYRRELLRVSPKAPSAYSGVLVVHGSAHSLQNRIEDSTGLRPRYIASWLSAAESPDYRWRPSALAAGFRTVRYCTEERCPELWGLDTSRCLAESEAYCIHGVTGTGDLALSFMPPGSSSRSPAQPRIGERLEGR